MNGAAIVLQRLGVYEPVGVMKPSEDQRSVTDSNHPAQEALSLHRKRSLGPELSLSLGNEQGTNVQPTSSDNGQANVR